MSFQGIEFTPEMRKMVVNVKHFFDHLKSALEDINSKYDNIAELRGDE